ncbi:MAG: protein kinase [Pseudorhodoferax sp.]
MNAAVRHPSQGLPPGTRLGEFELHGLLGAGGFGMVYRAYDHSLHRTVAIKEYLPGGLADRMGQTVTLRTGADARRFADGLRSFMNEARLLAQFDHPALVKVLRVWEQNRTAYMAMPLYQGVTLKEACAQHARPAARALAAQAAVVGAAGARAAARGATRCTAISRPTTSSCRTSARPCCWTWARRARRWARTRRSTPPS